jgi:thioesterase domain-containing protein
VLGTQEGLGHFLDWQRQTFGIVEGDRAAQITALSFDVVLRDIFLALTSGATLCIPSEHDILDASVIFSWMEKERITILHIVPSLAHAWLNRVPVGVTVSCLRNVFFAGEPLNDILINRFRKVFGATVAITNLYGPTETTLAKCFHRVGEPQLGVQPIGYPIPNTQILILTPRRQVCGLYEAGEIAIRTPFRTLGYLNAPEANARAFIRNPYCSDPRDLIYLTGDRGRYRNDGVIEIEGRIDNQVKIRGMRVEPAEVEGAISHHPDIREAAVVAFDHDTAGKSLSAYLVFKQPVSNSQKLTRLSEVRAFLAKRLPEHMIPSAFTVLHALPLNANGKLDKRALPPPDLSPQAKGSNISYEQRSETERKLGEIWCAVLGVSAVGPDDDFFAAGGHSLLAMSMIDEVRHTFRRHISLGYVFKLRTLRALAAAIDSHSDKSQGEATVVSLGRHRKLNSANGGAHLICLCGIELYEQLANTIGEPHEISGVFLPIEERVLSGSATVRLSEMASMYGDVVRAAQPHGPYRLAGLSFGGMLAFELACQLQNQGETVDFLGIFDTALRTTISPWTRFRGHARLAVRHGPSYLTNRFVVRVNHLLARVGRLRSPLGNSKSSYVADGEHLARVRARLYRAAEDEYERHIPRFRGDLHYFRAAEQSRFESEVVPADYNWSRFVEGLCYVHEVPGGHLSMLSVPAVYAISKVVRASLTDCLAGARHSASGTNLSAAPGRLPMVTGC